jgi:GNAT superfamily N-acetyltransferase
VGFADGAASRDDDVDAKRVGELYAIYVTPDAWGTGAGRGLMAAHLERLRSAGFEEAVLWVLDDNPRARRFYEAAGWTTDGAAKDYELLGTRATIVRYRIDLTRVTTG